jgi:hypothetical protein
MPEASTPTNLVVGGDFSNGAYWHLLVGFDATFAAAGNEGCITLHLNAEGGIGWPGTVATIPPQPMTVNLVAGMPYTFAYTVRTMGSLNTVDAKVGHSTAPYTPDTESMLDSASPTPVRHTHMFNAPTPNGDLSAGISFMVGAYSIGHNGDIICFSNVSITAN